MPFFEFNEKEKKEVKGDREACRDLGDIPSFVLSWDSTKKTATGSPEIPVLPGSYLSNDGQS